MNKTIISGRLTKDPVVKIVQSNGKDVPIGRFVLAVQRRFKQNGEYLTDFIPCVAFGSNADFAEKYLAKGRKVIIEGRTQTGNYEDGEGRKVFTFEVVAEHIEFAESKKDNTTINDNTEESEINAENDGFMVIPDEEVGLPLLFDN